MDKTKSKTIEAEGRIFSQKNQVRLKSLLSELAKILAESGVPPSDLEKLMKEEKEIEEIIEDSDAGDESDEPVMAAMQFSEEIKLSNWFTTVGQTLNLFSTRFLDLFRGEEAKIKRSYGTTADRESIGQQMILDLSHYLMERIQDAPNVDPDMTVYPYFSQPLYASADEEDSVAEDESPASEDELAQKDLSLELPFECSAGEAEISASELKFVNHRPFEGVLFRIDEPSESAPSKGSKLPLYIPRDVAENALQNIAASKGLPLDVDNTLSKHANNEIAGVMTSGEIRGNDALVKGHLFPWSQGGKVAMISANAAQLGMSMNAHAKGHEATVNGIKVYHIDQLELLGANILYADKATYKRTKLVTAEESQETTTYIAAQEEDNMNPEIQSQLAQMNAILQTIVENSRQESYRLDAIEKELIVVQAEREEIVQAASYQKTQKEKELENQQLIDALDARMAQRLQEQNEAMLDQINPRRQPMQITRPVTPLIPIAASSARKEDVTKKLSDLEIRIIAAEGKMQGYSEEGVTGPQRIALTDQIYQLKQEHQLLQGY